MKKEKIALLNNELAKEETLLQAFIDERNILILEQRQLIINNSVNDNNSYMSLSDYDVFSNMRKENFLAKNREINLIEDKIKESSMKVADYEVRLGTKKAKDAKKEYSALCDRMTCENDIRKNWLISAYLNDYEELKINREMLLNKMNKDNNPNEKLLNDLKSEIDSINDQMDLTESSRQEALKGIDVLTIDRNGLLDRGKQLTKSRR